MNWVECMDNSIKASLSFYFKGEHFEPSAVIDLDRYFQLQKDMGFIYDMLAKSMGLDEYRHEYDVMRCEDISFSDATGIAADFVCDGRLDWDRLEKAWQEQQDFMVLTPIANKFFNVENLKDDPKLAAALLAAYRAGQNKSPDHVETKLGLNEGFYG